MENLDSKTLVHVGVELVVIGGLSFWFQRKTSLQQEEINSLREKINKAEEIINRQGELLIHQKNVLDQHSQILNQLTGGKHFHKPQVSSHHNHQHLNDSPEPVISNQTFLKEEDDVDNSELDDLLKDEIRDMNKTRNNSEEEYIEVKCNDGVCDLKEGRKENNPNVKENIKKKRKGKKKQG